MWHCKYTFRPPTFLTFCAIVKIVHFLMERSQAYWRVCDVCVCVCLLASDHIHPVPEPFLISCPHHNFMPCFVPVWTYTVKLLPFLVKLKLCLFIDICHVNSCYHQAQTCVTCLLTWPVSTALLTVASWYVLGRDWRVPAVQAKKVFECRITSASSRSRCS